jgi:ribose/xylose/arabinose/galactoside ABC-type transport system permease subunit
VKENAMVKVELPIGAKEIVLEGNAGSGWQKLDQKSIPSHDRPQQATIPSLATIRTAKAANWNAVRVVVTQRELPRIGIPAPSLILLVVAIAAGVFLNHTIYGRYLLALGRNEEAAKYSGINTDRMIILAYVICSLLAGLGGMLFVMDVNSAQPVDFGNFYELYAIAAAVLGGCSLRGGEGTILGVIIGACLMRVLKNMITLVDAIPTHIEYAIIGAVILAGVTADELIKRYAAKRAAAKQQ